MKNHTCLILISGLFSIFPLIAGALADIDGFIIESARTGDVILSSGHCSITYNSSVVDTTSHIALRQKKDLYAIAEAQDSRILETSNHVTVYVDVTFDDSRVRIHKKWDNVYVSGRIDTIEETRAFNGEKMDVRRTSVNNENGKSTYSASIIPVCFKYNKYDPLHYGYHICGTPVYDFLTGSFGASGLDSIEMLGGEVVEGVECTVVRGNVARTDSIITAWLVPDMMHRPKRIEVDTSTARHCVTILYRQYNDYLWFPKDVRFESFYSEKKGDPLILAAVWTMTIDSVELNVAVPDSVFEIDFPTGSMVYDFRTEQLLTKGYDLLQNTR